MVGPDCQSGRGGTGCSALPKVAPFLGV